MAVHRSDCSIAHLQPPATAGVAPRRDRLHPCAHPNLHLHTSRPAPRPRPPPLLQGNGDLLFNGVHQVQDKGYAFVEFRSVEEASNAMALDGVKFRDAYLKVGRGLMTWLS